MTTTLRQLETAIDRPKTIRQMKLELEQLYYYAQDIPQGVEESALSYMTYTSSIIYAGKKQKQGKGDEQILCAIEEKDRQRMLQIQLEEARKAIAAELLKGIASLPKKEKILVEDVYLRKREKSMICYQQGISESTLRRNLQTAIYHLAILLHKTVAAGPR